MRRWVFILALLIPFIASARADEFVNPKANIPPKAKPDRRNAGRPEFNSSFRDEIQRIFPDRQLTPIPADHPIYSSFYSINSMRVRKGSEPWATISTDKGLIETINIGTRAAVIFSPIDLSCG